MSQIVNLAVTQYSDKNMFSVSSNSTVSSLAFNSTSRQLSFTVSGDSGTFGYTDVCIAKTLIQDSSAIKISLDGNPIEYSTSSLEDSWILHFTYSHSAHSVSINLGDATMQSVIMGEWLPYIIIVCVAV